MQSCLGPLRRDPRRGAPAAWHAGACWMPATGSRSEESSAGVETTADVCRHSGSDRRLARGRRRARGDRKAPFPGERALAPPAGPLLQPSCAIGATRKRGAAGEISRLLCVPGRQKHPQHLRSWSLPSRCPQTRETIRQQDAAVNRELVGCRGLRGHLQAPQGACKATELLTGRPGTRWAFRRHPRGQSPST